MKNLEIQKQHTMRQLEEAQKSVQEAKELLASHRYNSDDCGEYLNMIHDLEYWDNRVADLNEELHKIDSAIEKKLSQSPSSEETDIVTIGTKCLIHYDDIDDDLIVMLTEYSFINDEKADYISITKDSPLGQLIFNQKVGFSGTYKVSDSLFEAESKSFNITIVKIL